MSKNPHLIGSVLWFKRWTSVRKAGEEMCANALPQIYLWLKGSLKHNNQQVSLQYKLFYCLATEILSSMAQKQQLMLGKYEELSSQKLCILNGC